VAPPAGKNVRVPIKIVIGKDVDGRRLRDNLANLAGKQLGRAMNILDEGAAWEPNLAQLDVEFTGGAANLTEDQKRALYGHVGDGLAKGTEIAQTRRTRVADGGKQRTPRRTGGKKKSKGKAKVGAKLKSVAEWQQFSGFTDPDAKVAFRQAATDWMDATGQKPFPRTYGILLRLKGEPAVQLWVVHNGVTVCVTALSVVDWSGSEAKTKPKADEPNPFKLYLAQEIDGFAQYRSNAIETRSKQRAKKERKIGAIKAEKIGPEETQRQWTADDEKVVDAYMKGWEASILVYYWLHGMGGKTLYPFYRDKAPALPVVSRIELIALVDIREEELTEAEEAEAAAAARGIPNLPDAGGGGDQGKGDGGGGGADKGFGLGSDVTALPGQDVGEGGRGVVHAPPEQTRKGAAVFPNALPSDPNAKSSELPCEPYKDEPPVDSLPGGGQNLKRLIARIAARLDMAPCPYAANFCLQAGRMLRIRASQIQERFSIDTSGEFSAELSVGTFDQAGRFRFRGMDSVGVQFLQHLAGTVPLLRELLELVRIAVYPVTTFGPHHWFEDVMDEATQACGLIWLSANQIMMQQLLNSSRHGVLQRKGNPEYARAFAAMCKAQLADQVELVMLRASLEKFLAIVGDRKGADAYLRVRQHVKLQTALEGGLEGRKRVLLEHYGLDADLVTRMADETDYVFHRGLAAEQRVTDAGSILQTTDGRWVIRTSDGDLYDRDQLKGLIEIRQKVIVSIDPLMNQLITRLQTAIRPLAEDPDQIPAFLDKLFDDMLTKNEEVSRKNKGDFEYAFEHAQIHKVERGETVAALVGRLTSEAAQRNQPARRSAPAVELPNTQLGGWQLSGVHALAHLHVGVRFENDPFYVAAVSRLISQEYYWRTFAEDMVFIFGIAFTIICPPLGAALSFLGNLALGLEAYGKAKEQETIYGAHLNPEEVLNYAEIQIDLFLAKLQISLSFLELLPGAGKGVKALAGLGKKSAREGAKRGLRKLAKEVVMEELERIAKLSAENFVKALALELVEESVEDKIVDALVTPIIKAHIAEIERELREGRE
jgi:hypothetical protein